MIYSAPTLNGNPRLQQAPGACRPALSPGQRLIRPCRDLALGVVWVVVYLALLPVALIVRGGGVMECYICGRALNGRGEKDHFPTPVRMGGKLTMDICLCCHNEKDRIPLKNWDPSFAFSSLWSLWDKANQAERLILAKVFHIASRPTQKAEGE